MVSTHFILCYCILYLIFQQPTPSVVTEDRMLYCGVPTKCDSLGGDEVVANMNDLHAVRCCAENANLNWESKCYTIGGVFGESHVPDCYTDKTFHEAASICAMYDGGRLCTGDEMKDGCTRGTGCGANSKLVWGCTDVQGTCTQSAECCEGLCNQGFCESPSSPTNAPTIGPLCSEGYINSAGNTCCAASCGRCGGSGCGSLPGGSSNCCSSQILTANVTCTSSSQTVCVLPSTPSPTSEPTNEPTNHPTAISPTTTSPTSRPTLSPTPNVSMR